MKTSWGEAARLYGRRHLIIIGLMGFASGLPLLLTGGTLGWFLAKQGVDKTTIGLFAAVGIPYAWKFIWSPLIDQIRLPILHTRLGRRRGWLLPIQVFLTFTIALLALTDPATETWRIAVLAVLVAFFSASQDIVVDAYRIDLLKEEEQGAGASMTQTGYRLAVLIAGAGAQALSDFWDWHAIYGIMALLSALGILVTLAAPEPKTDLPQSTAYGPAFLKQALIEPFRNFARHRGWVVILLFTLFYKFGDAVLGAMAQPFYLEMQFTGIEVASITKIYGFIATILGTIIGGAFVARKGIFPSLLIGGILQAATNLLFTILALKGHDIYWLGVAITADNLAGGFAAAAFVAYLSKLCSAQFTATQYALLSSLAAQGRTIFATGSGWLATQLGWENFFALTSLLAIPGLLMLFWLWHQEGKFYEAKEPA